MKRPEGRAHERRAVAIAVKLRPAGSEALYWGQLLNLSVAGALVEVTEAFPVGGSIEIEFLLPPNFICAATAIWQTATGVGVHFENLGATELQRIAEIMGDLPESA